MREICGFFSFFVWFWWLVGLFIIYKFLSWRGIFRIYMYMWAVTVRWWVHIEERGEGYLWISIFFFFLGVNLGFLGTLCVWKRGQVVFVEDGTAFLFLFLFSASERKRKRKRSMFWCGRERKVSWEEMTGTVRDYAWDTNQNPNILSHFFYFTLYSTNKNMSRIHLIN